MSKFPKIIHQCFLGFDGPIPEKWKNNHEKWKELHPDYEVRLWDMEQSKNLINEIKPEFLKIFDNYQYNVERADAVRYFILYKYGGIYADLDLIPQYKLDSLLALYENDNNLKVLLAQSNNSNIASNFFIISKSAQYFWLLVIEEMIRRVNIPYLGKHVTIYNETGPLLMNDMKNKYNQDQSENYVEIIPRSILNSCDLCGECTSDFNYIIDEHAASWNSLDTKILNFLNCKIYKKLKKINIINFILATLLIIFLYKQFKN